MALLLVMIAGSAVAISGRYPQRGARPPEIGGSAAGTTAGLNTGCTFGASFSCSF